MVQQPGFHILDLLPLPESDLQCPPGGHGNDFGALWSAALLEEPLEIVLVIELLALPSFDT